VHGDHGHNLLVDTLARCLEEVLLRIPEAVLILFEPKLLDSLIFGHTLLLL
jgi:hypothetical protein